MTLAPKNLLVLMSDEHSARMLGAAGHPLVHTPNLDALAARGTRFTSAYTTSPICVPARAGFATGRYPHEIGYWDNADAYDGAVPSWHHRLRERGHRVDSIGKLHFRGLPGDDHGFSHEYLPMHVVDGVGDVKGLVRENIPRRNGYDKLAKLAGPGETPYTRYDRDIAAQAQIWLHEQAPLERYKPWALFVSFVCPHFPLTAPPEFYYRYPHERIALPKQYAPAERPDHPYLRDYDACVAYDLGFGGDAALVRRAIAGYMALVSFMDQQVGLVLRALDDAGLAPDTRVVYTSDHGDNVGARGLWGKSTMYEESAGVPLILAGPDIAAGATCADAGEPCRSVPFLPRLRGRARRALRRPRCVAAGRGRGRPARSRGAQRVPRHRLDRRHDHAAQGPLEVRALRALPAAAVRPAGRSRGARRSRRTTRRAARSSRARRAVAPLLRPCRGGRAGRARRQAELLRATAGARPRSRAAI